MQSRDDTRVRFRGVAVCSGSVEDLVARVVTAASTGTGTFVTFVNPHSFNILSAGHSGFAEDLAEADAIYADGIGVVWAVRALTGGRLKRVSFDMVAPELFHALAESQLPVYLLGGTDGRARDAATALLSAHPRLAVVGTHHGFVAPKDVDRVIDTIRMFEARVVVIGAGAPVQERFGNLIRRRLPGIAVITCGGYFDQVILGNYYPAWAYPLRLNWLVRMWHEPRRLWRRYLIGTPKFAIQSIAWRLHRGRHRSTDTARP